MSRELEAIMYHEDATDWVFLRIGDDEHAYEVLDKAESRLYARDDLEELIEAAEDQGDGTSRLELGTVTVTDDGAFEELTVTAEAATEAAQ